MIGQTRFDEVKYLELMHCFVFRQAHALKKKEILVLVCLFALFLCLFLLGNKKCYSSAFACVASENQAFKSSKASTSGADRPKSIYIIDSIMSSEAMILAVMNAIFSNCADKPEKFRTSTRFELLTSRYRCMRRPIQLSYEATDVGSWSFVGSNFPVRNESTMK